MENNIPKEYLQIKDILDKSDKQFLFLYNFGPCKLLNLEETIIDKESLTEFYSNSKLFDFDFFPFAKIGRNDGTLLIATKNNELKGIFYAGFFPKTKHPVKISDNFSNLIPINILGENLISEDEIYAYEELQYNSYDIIETPIKGVIPINNDIRKFFKQKFKNSILIDKESDHQEILTKFFKENKIDNFNLPDGRYYSSDFEEISNKIRKEFKINFYHSQFIPSDYYGIGIYTDNELGELLRLGLINDENLELDDLIYKNL
ncbi:hypothetical protein [Chryseobacterium sp. EO14]|uniref:hypothetical protein n=1 Tax=Chryseobacterium sp. EO14 TaxID=2950551 RepID=UPI002109420D|nr:hypothetical protein [Chryseobacterium sp. EO14]MCQ4140619.1 hypothetical protein [Chryseobacterium sp. EO14]